MPRVPTKPIAEIETRPPVSPFIQVPGAADPRSFGAGVGGAITGVGEVLGDIGERLAAQQEKERLEDVNREAKELDLEASRRYRELLYGTPENPGGYLNTRGKDSFGVARANVEGEIKAINDALRGRVTSQDVLDLLNPALGVRTERAFKQTAIHAGDQRRVYDGQVSDSRISEAIQAATAAFSDREILILNLDIVKEEVEELGERDGLSEEVIQNTVEQEQTALLDAVITAASREDNALARRIFEDFENQIDGTARATIRQRLDARDRQLLADQERLEKRQEKEIKDRQDSNYETAIVAIIRKQLSEDQLVTILSVGAIRGGQFTKLLAFNRKERTETGDFDEFIRLKIDITKGEKGLEAIVNASNLSDQQEEELVDLVDTILRRGSVLARADVKDAITYISDIVGGVVGPYAILEPELSLKVSVALDRFRELVIKAGADVSTEALLKIRDDVVQGFAPSTLIDPIKQLNEFKALPPSSYWFGPRWGTKKELFERLDDAKDKASKADLTRDELIKELRILKEYEGLIERMPE